MPCPDAANPKTADGARTRKHSALLLLDTIKDNYLINQGFRGHKVKYYKRILRMKMLNKNAPPEIQSEYLSLNMKIAMIKNGSQEQGGEWKPI